MQKKIKLFGAALAIATAGFLGCSEDNGTSYLNIRLTDAPTSLDEVWVDIEQVRVNFADDSTGWQTINTQAGMYDLLTLQNGQDTLLATGQYPMGSIVKEVRFILGDDNYVMSNGTRHELTIPSGSTSGLKIKVDKALNADLETLIIDFDAAASVRQENDGSYRLRPVLKVK